MSEPPKGVTANQLRQGDGACEHRCWGGYRYVATAQPGYEWQRCWCGRAA